MAFAATGSPRPWLSRLSASANVATTPGAPSYVANGGEYQTGTKCWSGQPVGRRGSMRTHVAILLLFGSFSISAQRKPGSPLDHLPGNIEILTYFGERADFSPDNQRVAFMAKSFGDAFVIDLKSRIIRCLTCDVPGAAFLRVMHAVTGDYILIGPERFKDLFTSRSILAPHHGQYVSALRPKTRLLPALLPDWPQVRSIEL